MSRIARGNLLDENAIVAVLGMFDFLEGNLPADFAAIFSNDLFGRSPEKLSQLGDFLLADPDESGPPLQQFPHWLHVNRSPCENHGSSVFC